MSDLDRPRVNGKNRGRLVVRFTKAASPVSFWDVFIGHAFGERIRISKKSSSHQINISMLKTSEPTMQVNGNITFVSIQF